MLKFVRYDIDLRSWTGQDGCICNFKLHKARQSLEFVGMKIVKGVSVLLSIFSNADCTDGLNGNQYAIGFVSSSFVIWNLTHETEVVKIPCGGWRRPHSYYIGGAPDRMYCFGFLKNDLIHVHRYWEHESKWKIYPKNLHCQFHGREVHSLCFINEGSECCSSEKHLTFSRSGWIASGSEDGTVRLSRYNTKSKNWSTSKLLGEHVNGSAVKSLCVSLRLYTILGDPSNVCSGVHGVKENLGELDNFSFLISVGAKRVLTVWKQRLSFADRMEKAAYSEPSTAIENDYNESCSHRLSSSPTFEWLSADMPAKCTNKSKGQGLENGKRNVMSPLNPCDTDEVSNDWRYLAVTAFHVKILDSRISACFVVVASSDATVTMRALLLPCRLWFDVATFTSLSSPVLALDHLIIPKSIAAEGHVFLVITGSTDGSVGFWDLTSTVENFMQHASSLDFKDSFDSQRKPHTGRGSQGGRRWKSMHYHLSKEKSACDNAAGHLPAEDDGSLSISTVQNFVGSQTSEPHQGRETARGSSEVSNGGVGEEKDDCSALRVPEIKPLYVLINAHQSGVNCLYVSDVKDASASENRLTCYIVSGGDDQVLNRLTLDFISEVASQKYYNSFGIRRINPLQNTNLGIHTCKISDYTMTFLSLEKIVSAHSSAIKGVWTDGYWVFSTGLDQRVKCWTRDQNDKLVECAHTIISVPEPETLDACRTDRSHYLIAIAGRGMQMVEFLASP